MRLILLSLLIFSTQLSAAVYQYLDENGNIVFSDKEVPGSIERKIYVPPVVTFRKNEEAAKKTAPADGSLIDVVTVSENEKKAKPYVKFKISKPVDDEAYRDNLGNVNVQLFISPSLQVSFGHKIKVEFDGKTLPGSWTSSTISFSNVDRGTHSISAFIVDKSGSKIKSSATHTFHLLRFSSLFR